MNVESFGWWLSGLFASALMVIGAAWWLKEQQDLAEKRVMDIMNTQVVPLLHKHGPPPPPAPGDKG